MRRAYKWLGRGSSAVLASALIMQGAVACKPTRFGGHPETDQKRDLNAPPDPKRLGTQDLNTPPDPRRVGPDAAN